MGMTSRRWRWGLKRRRQFLQGRLENRRFLVLFWQNASLKVTERRPLSKNRETFYQSHLHQVLRQAALQHCIVPGHLVRGWDWRRDPAGPAVPLSLSPSPRRGCSALLLPPAGGCRDCAGPAPPSPCPGPRSGLGIAGTRWSPARAGNPERTFSSSCWRPRAWFLKDAAQAFLCYCYLFQIS